MNSPLFFIQLLLSACISSMYIYIDAVPTGFFKRTQYKREAYIPEEICAVGEKKRSLAGLCSYSMSSRLTRCVAVVSLVSCVRHRDKQLPRAVCHTLTRPLIGGAAGTFLYTYTKPPQKSTKKKRNVPSSTAANGQTRGEKAFLRRSFFLSSLLLLAVDLI